MWQGGFPSFFFRRLLCLWHEHLTLGSQDHQKGVSKYTQGNVTVPSLPGSHFIVIQANLSFALFKTLLYGPTPSNRLSHFGKRRPTGCKDEHIGQLSGFFSRNETASNHQISLPPILLRLAQFNACPIKLARSLAPIADTEALPLLWQHLICEAIHPLAFALHLHLLLTRDRQRIRLLARFQTLPQRTMASIDGITRHPHSRESCIQGTPQHAGGQFWLGGKDDLFWHIGGSTPIGTLCPTLGQIQFAIHKGMVCL